MEYIAHRINTIEELIKVPSQYGVELDLRDYQNQIIIQHDPFCGGEIFEEYLKHYHHQTMILNIKSEGIERRVLKLIHKYQIKKYFLLDCSFPMIFSLSQEGEKNIALRFSEFESIQTIINMKGLANWVWIDCFTRNPLSIETYNALKDFGFKLCFVSPDLQKQEEKIVSYRNDLQFNHIQLDAICTKIWNIPLWM